MITRRGIMLLEVAVAITLTAALLYGATFVFSAFGRIDRTARERVQASRTLARLAEQFRSDVYQAREIAPPPQAAADTGQRPLIRLKTWENRWVEYRAGQGGGLARTVFDQEKAVEQDVFVLGPAADFSIEMGQDRRSLVTLVVATSRTAGASDVLKVERRVTALLSRDHRYVVGSVEKSEQ